MAYANNTGTLELNAFGLLPGTNDTLYASWNWTLDDMTKHYSVIWSYDTGDGVWITDIHTTLNNKESKYYIPYDAARVRFTVRPVPATYKFMGLDFDYFGDVSSLVEIFEGQGTLPVIPPIPNVSIENVKLTTWVDGFYDGDMIQFEIIKNSSSLVRTVSVGIIDGKASYSLNVDIGYDYTVRCRAKLKTVGYGGWSEYSEPVSTAPLAPLYLKTCSALSETSVKLEWKESNTAETYEIEYATNKDYLGKSNASTKLKTEDKSTTFIVTGLESGEEHFFRVRAVNQNGSSEWGYINSVILGVKPDIPTTWSSSTTTMIGDAVVLYWVHNSKDNSTETNAELSLSANDITKYITFGAPENNDESNRQYILDTSAYEDGSNIEWKIRTKGVSDQWSDWSTTRTIKVHTPPSLTFYATDYKDEPAYVVETFPIVIHAQAGPKTQKPLSYKISIIANESYETHDKFGRFKVVSKGDELYANFFDTSTDLILSLKPSDVILDDKMSYTIKCTVGMDSGLSVEGDFVFDTSFDKKLALPNAIVEYDKENVSVNIRPYCIFYPEFYYKVVYDHETGYFFRTSDKIQNTEGVVINDSYTETNDIVYYSNNGVFFCKVIADEPELMDNISLSVYRIESNGRFVEIASDINNTYNTYVTDPHPTLGKAQYRVSATNIESGQINFVDITEFIMDERAVILQWKDDTDYILKLPYNIDISDSNKPDVSLINYIGRNHPVSYYGTHLGHTSTWNMDIVKNDFDTLDKLRRLASHMGDVYVREPSGSGYWANLTVSFDQTHNTPVIPVTLDITRVEGGI